MQLPTLKVTTVTQDLHVHPAVKQRQAREYAKAVKTAQDAVTSARSTYGESCPQVAEALCSLGLLHQVHSNFAAAKAVFLKALSIREQDESDSTNLVRTLRATARLYDASGQDERARLFMQRATRIESDAFKANRHPVESAQPEYSAHADFVEEMAGCAPKTFWTQALGGILLPLFLGFRGTALVVVGRMALYGRGWLSGPLIVEGAAARMIGLVWLCGAAFAHFHFFWPYRNRTLCSYGKAVAFVAGFVLLFAGCIKMWMG